MVSLRAYARWHCRAAAASRAGFLVPGGASYGAARNGASVTRLGLAGCSRVLSLSVSSARPCNSRRTLRRLAGTDANVHVTLHGPRGSAQLALTHSNHRNKFERAQVSACACDWTDRPHPYAGAHPSAPSPQLHPSCCHETRPDASKLGSVVAGGLCACLPPLRSHSQAALTATPTSRAQPRPNQSFAQPSP